MVERLSALVDLIVTGAGVTQLYSVEGQTAAETEEPSATGNEDVADESETENVTSAGKRHIYLNVIHFHTPVFHFCKLINVNFYPTFAQTPFIL